MLFLQELKKIVFSISYVVFLIVIVLALNSQGVFHFSSGRISRPQPGGNYGTKHEEIPEIIMPAALEGLWGEFCQNHYVTYPIGLIKNVKLNTREQAEIAEIISEITGVDKDIIFRAQGDMADVGNNEFVIGMDGNMQIDSDGNIVFSLEDDMDHTNDINDANDVNDIMDIMEVPLTARSDMEYSEFRDLMQRVDDILGGGSDYSAKGLIGFGTVPISYEEAVQRYNLCLSRDKITGGYARLFSDYAVAMVMSLLPVFLAVLMCMKDRQAKMAEIICARKTSSAKIIVFRYLAIMTAVMIPVIILSYVSNCSVWGIYDGVELDYLAPLKYDLGWIMPSIMIAAAVGMCLTELTNTPIALAVQGFWWLFDMNAGYRSVSDGYAIFRLAPRHNAGEMSYFRTQDYIDNFRQLMVNRLLFAGLSMLLIAVTIVVYEAKRKGKLYGNFNFKKAISGFGSRRNKSEA